MRKLKRIEFPWQILDDAGSESMRESQMKTLKSICLNIYINI